MADTENVCILLRGICHLVEIRDTIIARELEDVSLVLYDVDIDVASFERVDASTSINRVLVLIDLDDIVELVRSILVASEIVKVQPVGLAALSCDYADASDVSTRELTGKELQRRGAKIWLGSASGELGWE